MKKIALVTGGAGFIGSHVVDLLLKKDFEVRILDDFSGGHERNLEHNSQNINLKVEKKSFKRLIRTRLGCGQMAALCRVVYGQRRI